MMKKKYKFIDLFAGIGGFHLAFDAADAKCVFVSEWDESARKTYQRNFEKKSPDIFKTGMFAGDITKVKPKDIPDFDVICGGFPCQPFSQSGFKKGFKDDRGNLFFHIAEIIKQKKPKAFFLENVRHLLNHDDGKTFAVIKKTIEKDLGYSFYYKIVKASEFGVPQHRPRLFMVGFRDKKIKFEFPESIELQKTMADIFKGKCDKKIGFTLRVGGRGSRIDDRHNWDAYIVDGKVRRLMPEEGKRMMGFPEDYIFPVTDAQAMKQLGNAVAVPAITAYAKQIIKTLKKYDKGK
ncbi:DNA cytosine methyltransferase [Patescibacteria group bacterium]|nr:DNA cytosine methyltransferase [Patescibacteria group bacterium]